MPPMPLDSTHGFVVITKKKIPDLKAVATLWKHSKSGAQLLSLQNDDANKSFAITFPTLPRDNSGVAHILEHSVLNGSRKFPVKEPFVDLLKSSVCSFLNAFTYPDKTVYPLASQNEEDFYNLIDVYLDAVFFPKLSEQTFQQEGWHYEPTETDWIYKGVVFNEMKGAGLSADRCVWQATQEILFPDTPYKWDSGGVPDAIVSLTYQEFCQFHTENYHPSRALIWMSGNDPEERRLQTIAAYLDEYGPTKVAPIKIPLQKWQKKMKRVQQKYPSTLSEKKQVIATKTWVLPEAFTVSSQIELSVLEYLLVGTSTAVLRKALIDSGLGDDLAGGGMEFDMRQKSFSVGLRGIHLKDAGKVFAVISETLAKLAHTGFSSDIVRAAITSIEFNLREQNSGSFPQGLSLGLRVLRGWLYGVDPLSLLSFERPIREVREKLQSQPTFLQDLVKEYLIVNTHALELVLTPDPELIREREKHEQQKLTAFAESLLDSRKQELKHAAVQLQRIQQTPDTAEALNTLPKLQLSDLSKKSEVVPVEYMNLANCKGYVHGLQTNGIVYLDLAWPVGHLTTEQLPLTALFSSAITELGTASFPAEELQTVIDSRTGGLSTQMYIGQPVGSDQPIEYFVIRLKALLPQLPEMFELLHSLIKETTWSNSRRFKQLLSEERAQFESSIADDGHRLVGSRLSSRMTPAGWISEQLSGYSQLQYLRTLVDTVQTDWEKVERELYRLNESIFAHRCTWNLTVTESDTEEVLLHLKEFLEKLTVSENTPQTVLRELVCLPESEALTMASPVNFVGIATRLQRKSKTLSGSVLVATQLLRMDYLWNTVRVQGGAYGAGVRIDPISGVVIATSYRDPHLSETLSAFRDMGKYLQTLKVSDQELEKAKIGTVGDLDQYRLPDAKGFMSFVQELTGLTSAVRQELRDAVFATTLSDLHALGAELVSATFPYSAAVTAPERATELGQAVVITSLTSE